MSALQRLRSLVRTILAEEDGLPTRRQIVDAITKCRQICPDVATDEADALAREFEETYDVAIRPAAALYLPFLPWLDAQKSEIDHYYWDRYHRFLGQQGFPSRVVTELDGSTDRIVGYLENPGKPGRWDRRGMVMGHVQSGKTANYIGVATKAADAGYRVIVIIAGVQNKLRDQTQRRVDEGFIGLDTAAGVSGVGRKPVGVGRQGLRRQPVTFTTAIKDFSKPVAEQIGVSLRDLREPVVFVIKKNPRTLQNLIEWLKAHNARLRTASIEEPMLLIDDEADNASINIKHHVNDVSTINGLLRELLQMFDRSCYVGYTATPFANIFVDPNSQDEMVGHDLFPRNFIVCLNAPSNYFGPASVFGGDAEADGNPVLQAVGDHHELLPMSHSIRHTVHRLPPSLMDAVRAFLVARAIRLARGHSGSHSSMLINVTRFVAVQQQVRLLVHDFVDCIARSLRVNGARSVYEALTDPAIEALHDVFRRHYENKCGFQWAEIQGLLYKSASSVSVLEINSKSADSLSYTDYAESGLNVIAVGGLSLSRGLTLEGLIVSYVLRRSIMYDTLFQMGRWFGYRKGYEDLCRVWMPEVAMGWYRHIAESIEELRDELVRMQSVNATPMEFGLKVRAHPDALLVTARNKMGSGARHRLMIGLANRFVETTTLHYDAETVEANLGAVVRLAEDMRGQGLGPESGECVKEGRLVREVPLALVDRFFAAFKNHPGSVATAREPIRDYIARRAEELGEWDVLFAGVKKETSESLIVDMLGFPLICQRRRPGDHSSGTVLMVTNNQRVASRGVEKVGLTRAQIREAEESYGQSRLGAKNYPDRIYRHQRIKPLLVIHLLAVGKAEEDLSDTTPVAAWSLSVPKTERREELVEYVVNETWFEEHRFGSDLTDDDDEE